MHIETKFSNGDSVWWAHTNWAPVEDTDCPECGGKGSLEVQGKTYRMPCPNRCRYGKIARYSFVPLATQMTVGQVRLEISDSPGSDSEWGSIHSSDGTGRTNYSPIQKRVEQYMLTETGIGSGSIYNVEDLFATEAEALERACFKVADAIEYRRQEEERREKEREQARRELVTEEES